MESATSLRDDLKKWHLEEIADIFEKELVTKDILWAFKEDVLKEIGVGPVQRMKYFDAIEQMSASGNSEEDPVESKLELAGGMFDQKTDQNVLLQILPVPQFVAGYQVSGMNLFLFMK